MGIREWSGWTGGVTHLLLRGRLLLVRGELVRRFHHDQLAFLDAGLEGGPQHVLCKLDLRVRGLDELKTRAGRSLGWSVFCGILEGQKSSFEAPFASRPTWGCHRPEKLEKRLGFMGP